MKQKLTPLDFVLKKLRLSKGELAEELGIDRVNISKWAKTGNIPEKYKFAMLGLADKYSNVTISRDEINNGGIIDEN